MFEQAAGELHAKLMIDSHNWAAYSNPGPGRGAGGWRRGLAATTQTISTARLEAAARPAGPGRTTSRRAATHSTAGTTGVEGAGGFGGHGRASRSTTPSLQARVWRSRGRAAAHGHTKQPGPAGTRVRQRGGYRSTRPLSAHSATASSRISRATAGIPRPAQAE